ncbi:MAG: rhomboid family intramembrane serine protease [Deltaproteobacteria bacterium]|nr:rhomboid family intramembrane serine protease [Deltaproteobacteria bacterium]
MPRASNDFVIGPLRMPRVIAVIIGAMAVTSIAAAVLGRNTSLPLGQMIYLSPADVLRGQVWRLITWPLIEGEPIGLLFGGYTLYWVGRDLVDAWGERAFALRTLVLTLLVGVLTTAMALAWPVGAAGVWPLLDGLLVIWGLSFRNRTLNFFGMLPLSGLRLAQLTVGLTVLYALFSGVAAFIPHFIAEGLGYLWMVPMARWQRSGKTKKKPSGTAQVFSFADWYEENNKTKKN